ncbi:MAG: bifunctional 2-keto-4-hydroxyglutarate aldolase/2-keto-3-deoxy-6-phosphogluconate aldolase [Clostridia bacterium]
MQRHETTGKIKEGGLVAVVRALSREEAFRIFESCLEGGVTAIELTFTVPGAHRIIEELVSRYENSPMIIGAGTVLDPETARVAILSGARYIVSPYLNTETVKLCNRYQVPVMPGAMTIKEVAEAMEAGADIVKIFPGELFGPAIIKAIKGPLPQAQMMPTGGVSLDNVAEWIKAGAVAVGVGSNLTRGDRKEVVENAREFIRRIKEARERVR